ncbi:MAG: hypothetical protein K5864_09850 [Bacteroidales bacterium]|nr:hypothetical protein [Bacteroidales bacterium]
MKDYVFVAENNRILDDWRKSNEEHGETNFANDGIMNKGEFYIDEYKAVRRKESGKENRLWNECPLRILFLTKDENTGGNKAWDVRTETFYEKGYGLPPKNKTISGSFFYQNEACLLYGLRNTKPEKMILFDGFSWEEALKFSDKKIFARINCKKEAGGEKCEKPVLAAALDRDKNKDFLKRQILNLDADILVCCGHDGGNLILNMVKDDIYKDEFEYVDCVEDKGTGMHYNAKRNKLAIDAYHLAFFGKGGLEARYNETVGMYYEFLKYLKKSEKYKHIDFSASHR